MIIFFGPAGSGKSEQGQRIAKKYGWKWLSTGQLIRDQGDVGANKELKTGKLFDDNFVTELMYGAMLRSEAEGAEVILDGYPRNENQAKWLIGNETIGMIDGAIVLDVPPKELWKRIKTRGRADDTEEAINRRWEIFEQNIYSILPLLESKNVKITTIDGVGTIDEITERIEEILKEWGILNDVAIVGSEAGGGRESSYGE